MPKFYIFVTDCFCNVMPYTSYSEKLPGPGCRILFRTLVLTFCLCLLSGFEVRAQSAQRKFVVRGRVTDEAGTPLVGVTVVEHGTSNGVATLSGGEFSIGVAPGAVLDVSVRGLCAPQCPDRKPHRVGYHAGGGRESYRQRDRDGSGTGTQLCRPDLFGRQDQGNAAHERQVFEHDSLGSRASRPACR